MTHFVLLDTETTGAGEKDRIIQLGFMVLRAGAAPEVHESFCRPEIPIAHEAMEVHHITPEMIADQPPCVETPAFQRLQALNSDANYVVIHNASFDLGMLAKEGFESRMQLIDTLRCARHLLDDESSHRLQYLRYKLALYQQEAAEAKKLGIEIRAHDAIGDVLILKLLLSHLRRRAETRFAGENPLAKMVELTQKPVFYQRPLQFGKHKGKTLYEVAADDRNYLEWMLDKMENLDEDMRYSVTRVLEGK